VPPGIRVFQRTAHGNVAPVRAIAGIGTTIDTPHGILLDRPHQEVLLTDREGAINVFARTANGNAAPLRRIAGAASGLQETLAVSLVGNSEIVVTNGGLGGNDYSDDALLVFPRTATATARLRAASSVRPPGSTGRSASRRRRRDSACATTASASKPCSAPRRA
jgi:hypothetical protein